MLTKTTCNDFTWMVIVCFSGLMIVPREPAHTTLHTLSINTNFNVLTSNLAHEFLCLKDILRNNKGKKKSVSKMYPWKNGLLILKQKHCTGSQNYL